MFKFREIGRWEIGEIVHCLSDKQQFRLAVQLSFLGRSCPEFARASANNVLRVLQISSKSVHVRRSFFIAERVNTAKMCHKVNPAEAYL